jgi:UDP-N-acetylglucosamine:LPS N-acetylglucosamine transferase
LRERLQALLADRQRLVAMAVKARAASYPRAAHRVAEIALEEASA